MAKVEARSTLPDFAPHVPVAVPIRAISAARAAWVQFVTDNPLWWFWHQGKRNVQADMEGTYTKEVQVRGTLVQPGSRSSIRASGPRPPTL